MDFLTISNILSNIFHSNISSIFHENIHLKKEKTCKCEAPTNISTNLVSFIANSSGVGGRGGSP